MIDQEKLKAAFRRMRTYGLCAEQNLACCDVSGEQACRESKSPSDRGWAFYHHQADDAMKQGDDLYISYGMFYSPDTEDEDDKTCVGYVVLWCLGLSGLESEWDGDWQKKIVVLNTAGKPEPAPRPRPKLTLVAGTSRDTQKSENPLEKPAVRPESQARRPHAHVICDSSLAETRKAEHGTNNLYNTHGARIWHLLRGYGDDLIEPMESQFNWYDLLPGNGDEAAEYGIGDFSDFGLSDQLGGIAPLTTERMRTEYLDNLGCHEPYPGFWNTEPVEPGKPGRMHREADLYCRPAMPPSSCSAILILQRIYHRRTVTGSDRCRLTIGFAASAPIC